jgi:hypothetical protein
LADVNLTQAEADVLLVMEKHKVDDTPYEYPSLGGGIRIPLQSLDKHELFFLDITRSQVVLTKGTYQNRARGVAILARLDSAVRRTGILMTKRSRVRTCTCIAKGTEIDGRFRCQPSDSATLAIRGSCC